MKVIFEKLKKKIKMKIYFVSLQEVDVGEINSHFNMKIMLLLNYLPGIAYVSLFKWPILKKATL